MIQVIVDWFTMMHGLFFYPEVAAGCFFVYFVLRQRWDTEGKWSILVPVPLSFIGMLAFDWPNSPQGWSLAIFMSGLQWALGISFYSFADKYGWMDKFGSRIAKKIEEDIPNAPR